MDTDTTKAHFHILGKPEDTVASPVSEPHVVTRRFVVHKYSDARREHRVLYTYGPVVTYSRLSYGTGVLLVPGQNPRIFSSVQEFLVRNCTFSHVR